jgi:hypothetical protein
MNKVLKYIGFNFEVSVSFSLICTKFKKGTNKKTIYA